MRNWLIAIALLGSGGVHTEHDLAGPDNEAASLEPKLLGEWNYENDSRGPQVVEVFARIERVSPSSKEYRFGEYQVIRQEDGTLEEFRRTSSVQETFRLVKLGDRLFLTGRVSEDRRSNLILRVDRLDDEMHVSIMDHTWFNDHADSIAHGHAIPNVHITAASKELRAFVERHADDEDLWTPSVKLLWRRKKPVIQ